VPQDLPIWNSLLPLAGGEVRVRDVIAP